MAGWEHGGGFSVDAAVRIEGNNTGVAETSVTGRLNNKRSFIFSCADASG
jgi:hypothetical protein